MNVRIVTMPQRKEKLSSEKQQINLLVANMDMIVGNLVRFEQFVHALQYPVDEIIQETISLRWERIKSILEEYRNLVVQANSLSVTSIDVSYQEFEDRFFDVSAKTSFMLKRCQSNISSSASSQSIPNGGSTTNTNVKLPTLRIPSFSGEFSEWSSFFETFSSLIDRNNSLSDVEKFFYLHDSLKGNAKEILQDLAITSGNYQIALQMLKDRFENERLIIFSHLEGILEISKVTRGSSSELRKFHDSLTRHLRALDNLKLTNEKFKNAVISYTLKTKLDSSSVGEFSKIKPKQIPEWDEINKFLSQRCEAMEEASFSHTQKSTCISNAKSSSKAFHFKQAFVATNAKSSSSKCSFCKGDHYLNQCEKFLNLSVKQRFDKVSDLNLCKNCLRHPNSSKCYSKHVCQMCGKKHNKLLHFEKSVETSNALNAQNQSENHGSTHSKLVKDEIWQFAPEPQTSLSCLQTNVQVILATACVKVKGKNGWLNARCLLDSGSQQCFVTEEFINKLDAPKSSINSIVYGINSSVSHISSISKIQIFSHCADFQAEISCLIIPKITENLPFTTFSSSCLNIPSNIILADNNFNKSGPIDILLGASVFYDLLLQGQIKLGKQAPILQATQLGWIISGNVLLQHVSANHVGVTHFSRDGSLEQLISKFWEIEAVKPKSKDSLLSPSERFCEEYFSETIRNDETGRYIVSIPFNQNISRLGSSRKQAYERLLALERRFIKDPNLQREYSKFMQEYCDLGHMSKVQASFLNETAQEQIIRTSESFQDLSQVPPYYMPHHAILKPDSTSTKLRVVFDGSAKSESGISINETQIVGPVVQEDLFSILIRFREFKIALTGDIEKAYRQILVNPFLRKFQLILWRDNPFEDVSTYSLNTITYGTASASFLTTKCFVHLAETNSESYPKATQVLKSCFYMDDLLTGADSVQEVIQIKKELTKVLGNAGFHLRKFLSNNSDVLSSLGESASPLFTIPVGERENAKTLGVSWNSNSDKFQFKFKHFDNSKKKTKREILSAISEIFDPLGILQPVVIKGKLLIQKLWQLKVGWDVPIPFDVCDEWEKLCSQLHWLNSVEVPRCVKCENSYAFDLVGFSDASSIAYGACIYVRCRIRSNKCQTFLLCSKSRVAPLHGVTIPRLELCAAVLLAELMKKIQCILSMDFKTISYFTDSMIVLHWLKATPSRFKTFVANRVASVQEISDVKNWYHVDSKNNPSDLVSRGSNPQDLIKNKLWFHGPNFLSSENFQHQVKKCPTEQFHNDEKKIKNTNVTFLNVSKVNIFERFSTFNRLKRVVAWIRRFVNNARKIKVAGPLTANELYQSRNTLIKWCQEESFNFKNLTEKQNVKSTTHIRCLNPFLDKDGMIRVGGRISAADDFGYDKKFPILLPKNHILTKLIFKNIHESFLHCGVQQLLAYTRETYWPLNGRNTAKQVVHNCTKCFRAKPSSLDPFMGNLPQERLKSNDAVFTHVGVDYAGPVLIKDRKLRGSKVIKAYICLFVCLVTKSIHLELVTDLTTNAFIAVFKRFIGRRGKPNLIMSDNCSTFVGAANKLRELYRLLNESETQRGIFEFLSGQNITWKFIIPRAPHIGGIWESGIKSTKKHLTRVLGNTQLTYEDFQTLLVQVEAVLNSRPITPLSNDPNDLTPLTCGHFIIGKSLMALPDTAGLEMVKVNRLSTYENIQRKVLHFWNRWKLEVVPEYQRRTKWFSHLPDLVKIGSIVLLKEENLPPLQWSLGNIIEVHRSSDEVIRSASVRLANGNIVKRSVHKMCVFPSEN